MKSLVETAEESNKTEDSLLLDANERIEEEISKRRETFNQ